MFKWYPVWGVERGIQECFNNKEDIFSEYGMCDIISKKYKETLLNLLENFYEKVNLRNC